ncbi:hypothetical protein NDU88_008023 [Pleurodeles waltl]|uniref:Uncharacterized protein n=1 Tax=Pleurodeles waltl TaxID=8319 RepID=A0AAV7RRT3_PLEWA|nr:hypothetical protein NDU88_008023 [Pleurodeles waltl]
MAAPSDLRELSVEEENLMELSVEEENFSSGEGSHMFMAEQNNKAVIVIDSEEEGEVLELQVEEGSGIGGQLERGLLIPSGRGSGQTSNIVCQVGQGVQEWEVEDHSIFRAGGQGFSQKEQGRISQGTICGVTSEYGGAGSAQLGQKGLGQEQRAYLSGCVAPHVSSGHGVLVERQRSGRSAGGPVTVGVRAPPGRRIEERAQSGAVRLTAREVTPMEVRWVESNARGLESRSYSRSAILTGEEEEELDYGEDGEQVEAPQASTSGQAFRGERLSRREVAANLSREWLDLDKILMPRFMAKLYPLHNKQSDFHDFILVNCFVASLVECTSLANEAILRDPVDKKVDGSLKKVYSGSHLALRAGIYGTYVVQSLISDLKTLYRALDESPDISEVLDKFESQVELLSDILFDVVCASALSKNVCAAASRNVVLRD